MLLRFGCALALAKLRGHFLKYFRVRQQIFPDDFFDLAALRPGKRLRRRNRGSTAQREREQYGLKQANRSHWQILSGGIREAYRESRFAKRVLSAGYLFF